MSNKGLPNVWMLLRLMVDPGWAPIAVAVAFLLSVGTGFADTHDYVFHVAGGAAAAFFALRTMFLVPSVASRIPTRSRPVIALVVALVVAALWEVAEFASDRMLGTSFLHGIRETVSDFAYGAAGALLVIVVALVTTQRVPYDHVDRNV